MAVSFRLSAETYAALGDRPNKRARELVEASVGGTGVPVDGSEALGILRAMEYRQGTILALVERLVGQETPTGKQIVEAHVARKNGTAVPREQTVEYDEEVPFK